jgi:hypothetical protein
LYLITGKVLPKFIICLPPRKVACTVGSDDVNDDVDQKGKMSQTQNRRLKRGTEARRINIVGMPRRSQKMLCYPIHPRSEAVPTKRAKMNCLLYLKGIVDAPTKRRRTS